MTRHSATTLKHFPGIQLWTGLKKGPPRKLKFPEAEVLIESLREHL